MLRSIKNTRRLFGIAFILAREDALFLLEEFDASPFIRWPAKLITKRHPHRRKGQSLAKALERLGPTFIKLGQAISTRSDLIGDDIAADLASLRDKLPPFPSHEARAIIQDELGEKIEDIFAEFSDEPIAAASIAQVHKAITNDGHVVAVKIVRPHIEEAFARDIDLFFWIADIIQTRLPGYRRLKARDIVQTFKDTVFFELDLRFEAAAADEMMQNLNQHASGLTIPTIFWSLTARRVLTMAWVDGISFNDMEAIRASGFNQDELLTKAANSLFSQIFIDGFFHADLHPGNLFLDTESGNLVAVDFGIVGRLDWQSRAYIARIIHGFLNEDYRAVAELHFAAGYVPPHKSIEAFTQACRAVARPILNKPLNEISVAVLLGQMFKIAAEFEMETQPQLLLMQKTLMVAEGLGRMLNPKLNMWELSRPLIEEWANTHFSKKAQLKILAQETRDHALKLPSMLKKIERTVERLSDEQGIKLHPQSILSLHLLRQKSQRQWWWLALTALFVLTASVFILSK